MKFVVDESTGPAVAKWLLRQGFEVISIFESYRGIDDDEVIELAHKENAILITNDKDFGQKAYRDEKPHSGVVLMRLSNERIPYKIEAIKKLLRGYSDQIENKFIVITDEKIRISSI